VCRKIFEKIFGEDFPSERPLWLRGPKGGRLELDGFCKKLGIAFEYQGIQHYEQHGKYRGEEALEERKRIDQLKKQLCFANGVKLIEVPYTVDYEHMQDWIIIECSNQGINAPNTEAIDYRKLDTYAPDKLKELQKIATVRGGQCLSESYISATKKIKWRCAKGHVWETIPGVVLRGGWCPYCAGVHKLSIPVMQKLAEKKGGKCLSTEYVDTTTKLSWRCREGHVWTSAPANIIAGNWCPYCAGNLKLTIEDMQSIAEKRGGKCLSNKYFNVDAKLEWQCRKGHVWKTTPNSIKSGNWCPYCSRKAKHTIEEMYKIAEERGGKCLSIQYVNVFTKLKWRCGKGHVWEATPHHVSLGTWCPYCAREKEGYWKGKKLPPETITKISMRTKGRTPWNKGKKGVMPTPWNKGSHGSYSVPSRVKPRITLVCKNCGKSFQRLPSQIKRNRGICCSKKCFSEVIKGRSLH
jgi:thiol-disulfide isomerase/thioredoxin